MNTYMGIPISEHRFLTHTILFTVLFALLLAAAFIWMALSLSMKNKKDRQHVRNLKRRAKNDDVAKKQLEKIKRKNKRRRYGHKGRVVVEIVCWMLFIAFAAVLLLWCVIPGWMDFIKKDYVVYTGGIKVVGSLRQSHVELEDGTVVWGRGVLNADDTHGTVVFAKRSKMLLGAVD